MPRHTLAVILGCGVLLTSYVSAPAAPTAAPRLVTAAELAALDALEPLANDVAQETERLRARLAAKPDQPVPRRDPFRFGEERAPEIPAAPEAEAVLSEAPSVPTIAWPSLVAIVVSDGVTPGEDVPARTAVLGVGDGIEMLKAGETSDGFLVREVVATSVELVHVATSTAMRLSIR